LWLIFSVRNIEKMDCFLVRVFLQSMHLFLKEKKAEYGIRTSLENFSEYEKIKIYPLYAIENFSKK